MSGKGECGKNAVTIECKIHSRLWWWRHCGGGGSGGGIMATVVGVVRRECRGHDERSAKSLILLRSSGGKRFSFFARREKRIHGTRCVELLTITRATDAINSSSTVPSKCPINICYTKVNICYTKVNSKATMEARLGLVRTLKTMFALLVYYSTPWRRSSFETSESGLMTWPLALLNGLPPFT